MAGASSSESIGTTRQQNATAFIRQHRLTYPILRDGSGEVANDFGLSGLPTTFVLDSEGRIVRTLRGPQTRNLAAGCAGFGSLGGD